MIKHARSTINTNPPIKDLVISVEGKKISFLKTQKSLLECLEEENVEVHYHCRDGYCGACRVTLDNGEICYPNGEPLAYVGPNEILTCCCTPITDVTLSFE